MLTTLAIATTTAQHAEVTASQLFKFEARCCTRSLAMLTFNPAKHASVFVGIARNPSD
jgi:hypothetical protein